ncbi:hypothetical protein BDU57DRAFT_522193 [Ampelomyces quisqualis]|uniref:Uncharacterized protein n=1 Tax=Ampelomyces quisqualis TaxID=50730 RepID=A0A6A5QEN6_AMPQU|nr:hypothetical protein BDU57DRAFT_522193 [Ampelomyces quisqualis]
MQPPPAQHHRFRRHILLRRRIINLPPLPRPCSGTLAGLYAGAGPYEVPCLSTGALRTLSGKCTVPRIHGDVLATKDSARWWAGLGRAVVAPPCDGWEDGRAEKPLMEELCYFAYTCFLTLDVEMRMS